MKCWSAEVPGCRSAVLKCRRAEVPRCGAELRYVGPNFSSGPARITLGSRVASATSRTGPMTRRVQAGTIAAGLAIGLAVSTTAQQKPQDQPVFRTSTTAAVVDVIVRDRTGQPVHDLTEADFEVLEDGVPQRIISFEAHVSGAPGAGPDAPAPPAGASMAPTRSLVALVFQQLPHQSRAMAADAARTTIDALAPDEYRRRLRRRTEPDHDGAVHPGQGGAPGRCGQDSDAATRESGSAVLRRRGRKSRLRGRGAVAAGQPVRRNAGPDAIRHRVTAAAGGAGGVVVGAGVDDVALFRPQERGPVLRGAGRLAAPGRPCWPGRRTPTSRSTRSTRRGSAPEAPRRCPAARSTRPSSPGPARSSGRRGRRVFPRWIPRRGCGRWPIARAVSM